MEVQSFVQTFVEVFGIISWFGDGSGRTGRVQYGSVGSVLLSDKHVEESE